MQGFYGMKLNSRKYGEGTLKEWTGKTVSVKFTERTVRFWFPKAFECGELKATNEQDELCIRTTIDGWVTSLIERLKGPLSARVLPQLQLSYMAERVGKLLHGCYPAVDIEQRLLAYRETLLHADEAPREVPAPANTTPFRAFLRRFANLFALLPLIGMGVLGLICILAPFGPVAQLPFGVGLGSGYDYLAVISDLFVAGYDYLAVISDLFVAGFDIPVILAIVYAALLILGAVSVFAFPLSYGEIGYDIFGLVLSVAVFATGVGQAAWVGSSLIMTSEVFFSVSAGACPILLIVFGAFFMCFYTVLTVFRAIFHRELAVTRKKRAPKRLAGAEFDEHSVFMLLSSGKKSAQKTAQQ